MEFLLDGLLLLNNTLNTLFEGSKSGSLNCFFIKKTVSLLVKKQKKCMTQIVLTVPNGDVSFLSTLAEKMGWSFQTSENLVEKFIASCPTDVSISDEEIQAEVNAVRYGR